MRRFRSSSLSCLEIEVASLDLEGGAEGRCLCVKDASRDWRGGERDLDFDRLESSRLTRYLLSSDLDCDRERERSRDLERE